MRTARAPLTPPPRTPPVTAPSPRKPMERLRRKLRRADRKQAFDEASNDGASSESHLSAASVRSKTSQGSRPRPGSSSPSRSPSPLNRTLPPSLRMVQEEVRVYDPRSPALRVRKRGQIGPVRAAAKALVTQASLRSSDTAHPRRVTLGAAAEAPVRSRPGDKASARTPSPGRSVDQPTKQTQRSMLGRPPFKGRGKGKSKGSRKGQGKSTSKGKGKSKSKAGTI